MNCFTQKKCILFGDTIREMIFFDNACLYVFSVQLTLGPITRKDCREITGFQSNYPFSMSQLCDGAAYLLSVAVLPSPSPKEGNYSFTITTRVAG